MSARVYVLFDLVHADSTRISRILRGKPGVAIVDIIEGPPDLLMVIEAPKREMVADYLMNILDSVDGTIENLRVLPVCESADRKSRAVWETGEDLREKPRQGVISNV